MVEIGANAEFGSDQERISDYTADVVETLFVRPDGIGGALQRFGRRLGAQGWPLEEVSGWIDRLSDLCANPPADALRSFRAGVSLAQGWTEGSRHGIDAAECFDAVTGLCTTTVLRLRLQQIFERCSALDQEPRLLYRLVVIDADVADLPGLECDAVMVVLADLVQHHFTAGETIATEGGRIFVIVDNTENLESRIDDLADETRLRSLLRAARVFGWVEDLPDASNQIDRYLADLAI